MSNSDYALPVPPALLSANPSWLGAEVATSGTPTTAQIAPISSAGAAATVGSTGSSPSASTPASPPAPAPQPAQPSPDPPGSPVPLAPSTAPASAAGSVSAASTKAGSEAGSATSGAARPALHSPASHQPAPHKPASHKPALHRAVIQKSVPAKASSTPPAFAELPTVSSAFVKSLFVQPEHAKPSHPQKTRTEPLAAKPPAPKPPVPKSVAAKPVSPKPVSAGLTAKLATAPAAAPSPSPVPTPATAGGSAPATTGTPVTPEADTPATPPNPPVAPAQAAAPVSLPVPSGTTITAVTTGTITAVTPTPPTASTAAAPTPLAGSVPVTNTVVLTGSDGATYTYTGVVGAPAVGTPTTPGAKVGTAGPTGITFEIQVPDVVGQVCATSALEAWSVGTPVNIRSLPSTCVPGDLSVLTDGTLGGAHQNVLVVSDGGAGNTAADLKKLLDGAQVSTTTLNLDQTLTPAQQAAAIAQASVVTPAVAATPATLATATTPAKPATPAVPAVTSNLIVIALGGATPAEAAALTANLPATQQVLWVAPPLPNGSPAPPAGTPSVQAQYAAFLAAHPNVRIDTLSSSLALVTSGSVTAPASIWSTVGAQVVASTVAGYTATAYRLPTTSAAVSTVLSYAEAQLGKSYQWAGAGPTTFDCSGLTMDAFAQVGIHFTHNADAQYQATKPEAVSETDLQPGDLVFFAGADGTMQDPGHVGIYVGNGQYIDAPDTGSVVRFDTLAPGDGYVGASDPLATISLGPATTTSTGTALVDTSGSDPNQSLARALVDATWNDTQWVYLDMLWNRESGWNPNAVNPTSGAYGIPQSLPATKMDAVANDWATDATTQILWGVDYIQATYGSPQAAWAHETAFGWY